MLNMAGDLAPSVQGLHSLKHCICAQVHSHNTVVKTKKQMLPQQHDSVMEPRNVNALIARGPFMPHYANRIVLCR